MTSVSRADEGGFTLIELLVCIVILGIIMGALTSAVIAGLRSQFEAERRVEVANDRQSAAIYFANDVQSMTAIENTPGCSAAGTIAEGATLLTSVRGSTFSSSSTALVDTAADYYQRAFAGGTNPRLDPARVEVYRVGCGAAPASGVAIVRGLASVPSLQCQGPDGTTMSCTAVPAPDRVFMTLTPVDSTDGSSGVPYTLVGRKRIYGATP